LALQYVKSHSCRALVICPNNIVKDSWKGNGHWTVPVTYQTLASKYDPDTDTLNFDLSSYNLVILDEVHHAGYDEESGKGALLWGKAIQKLFDTGIKVLGLTATEIRSDVIDVSEQFFAGCNFEGYSFEKAIEEGIELFGICDHNYGIAHGRKNVYRSTSDELFDDYERTLRRYFDHISLLKEKYTVCLATGRCFNDAIAVLEQLQLDYLIYCDIVYK
jgi:hypothetical protein